MLPLKRFEFHFNWKQWFRLYLMFKWINKSVTLEKHKQLLLQWPQWPHNSGSFYFSRRVFLFNSHLIVQFPHKMKIAFGMQNLNKINCNCSTFSTFSYIVWISLLNTEAVLLCANCHDYILKWARVFSPNWISNKKENWFDFNKSCGIRISS